MLARYRINAAYIGLPDGHGIAKGEQFDAEIDVDFETGFVHIIVPRAQGALRLNYRNFKELELSWFIHGIYRSPARPAAGA